MNKITVTFLLIISVSITHAQQLPQHNEFKELGLSFDLPHGWNGQLYEDKVILGHSTIPGMILLTENPINNATELKNLAMQGFTEEGVVFKPISDFKLINQNRVEGFYQGYFNGAEVKVFVIGLINGLGSGMNIIILTELNKFSKQHISAANELASTVKFFQSQDSINTINWKNKIVGMQLKYMKTQTNTDYSGGSTGFSTTKIIDLCRNGMFYYYANDHSSMDSNSGSLYGRDNNQGQGQYKITTVADQTLLSLTFNSGENYESQLFYQEGKTYLDNDRYFVIESDKCY